MKAYSILYAILERNGVTASTTSLALSKEEFRELEATIADNYDVLDNSTITAWRHRKGIIAFGAGPDYTLEAGEFFGNIRVKYERFDKRIPYYHLREEDIDD